METVGGYRLVRRLGEGDRAEVWLGHAPGCEESVAAIKVYRETTPDDQIDIELDALTRGDSPHLLRLRDVGTAPDGRPCLILPRLGISLARTLGARSTLGTGELVTAAAPLVEAVRELRRVGVVHGAIGPATVLFDDFGAPVIAGFGYARVVGPAADGEARLSPADRDAEPGLSADLRQLGSLIDTLAGRAADRHGQRPAGVADLIGWVTAAAAQDLHGEEFLDELGGRLFDLAPATPIRFDGDPRLPTFATRQIPVAPSPSVGRAAPGRSRRERLDERLAQHIDTSPATAIRSRLPVVRAALSLVRRELAPVRRPVWIAGGAGLGALLLGLVVIPAFGTEGGSDIRHAPERPPSPTTGAATPWTDGSRPPAPADVAGPTASPAVGAPPAADAGASAAALTGDDPVAAASALIGQRARCLLTRDVGCLDAVDQPVSAALESDRYAVRTSTGAAARGAHPLPATPIALVQLLGDSAIIGLGNPTATDGAADAPPNTYPASILIVKTTNGWRIRDLTTGVSP